MQSCWFRRFLVGLVASTPVGCSVGPDYVVPTSDIPPAFLAEHELAGIAPDGPWWDAFGDPILSGLVRRVLASATDVRVAVARLHEARARAGLTAAGSWPEIGTRASYSNSRFSDNGFIKGLGGGGSPPGAIVPGQQIDLHEVGLDASWEVDVFGGGRRSTESATADLGAARADLRLSRVSVLGELTVDYCELRGRQAELDVERRLVAAQQDTVDVIRERVSVGIDDELDLARASSRLATLRARIPGLEAAIETSIRGIEILLGEQPGALGSLLGPTQPLPRLPEALAVGLPSELIARRPDVQAAERRLAAATARIGVAQADLLPRFSLTGSFGLQSQRLDELPQHDSVFWLLGPTLRWPLLDFGRVRARIGIADARAEEALARYEGVVTTAFGEVEIALVALTRDRRRLDELRAAEFAAATAATLADERHREGLLEYLDLLDARRTLDDARGAQVQAERSFAVDVVHLFKVLGGGWEVAEPAGPDPVR